MEWIAVPFVILMGLFALALREYRTSGRPVFDEMHTIPLERPKEGKVQVIMSPDPVTPPTVIQTPVAETSREKLYRVAKSCLGRDMSPLDVAPDELACAESVNGVYREAFGEDILKNVVSTAVLFRQLSNDERFEKIPHADILPGDISIAVTGQSMKSYPHGHVGVWGIHSVMSNDSSTGKWSAHFSLERWKRYYEFERGFPLHAFRAV